MKKNKDKAKADFHTHALDLARFISQNFQMLQVHPAVLHYKKTAADLVRQYLASNAERKDENLLSGIIAVRDIAKNATGGRIHLVVGLKGPIGEVFQSGVIHHPIDYESKSKFFLQILELTNDEQRPWIGNIHVHPFLCDGTPVKPGTLLDFVRREHGYQNELLQQVDAKIYRYRSDQGIPFWDPCNHEIIQAVLGQ